VWNNIALLVARAAAPHEVIDLSEDSDSAPPAPPARRPQPVLNNVARVAAPPVFHDVVDLANSSDDEEEGKKYETARSQLCFVVLNVENWQWWESVELCVLTF
jgi:hypothetical protein